MTAAAPERAVAVLLRDLPPLYSTEKPVSFDPVQMAFLQALVRESMLKASVTIAKADFFQATVYLDYFTEVVAARATLLEDARVIVEELEKMHRYLDPDLVLLVRYSGLYALKELKGERLLDAASLKRIRRRHEAANTPPGPGGGAEPDLFDQALGRMTCGLVSHDAVRDRLGSCAGRNDLRAALFADAILRALPPAEVGEPARAALAAGGFLDAAIELLRALVRASAGWSLKAHVAQLEGQVRG